MGPRIADGWPNATAASRARDLAAAELPASAMAFQNSDGMLHQPRSLFCRCARANSAPHWA
ncbi:hypothetical protein AWB99_07235 [Mycolicibacterium confluentis]|nr:hypothetical protein AWB99_07235 [Mycolicibacterium confluentis]